MAGFRSILGHLMRWVGWSRHAPNRHAVAKVVETVLFFLPKEGGKPVARFIYQALTMLFSLLSGEEVKIRMPSHLAVH